MSIFVVVQEGEENFGLVVPLDGLFLVKTASLDLTSGKKHFPHSITKTFLKV